VVGAIQMESLSQAGKDAEISRDEGELLYGANNWFLYPEELPQKNDYGCAVKTRESDPVLSREEIRVVSRLSPLARPSLLAILFPHHRHLRIGPEFFVVMESEFDILVVGLE